MSYLEGSEDRRVPERNGAVGQERDDWSYGRGDVMHDRLAPAFPVSTG